MQADWESHVFVTVSGGVAYAAHIPAGITLHIIDFDEPAATPEGFDSHLSLEEEEFVKALRL